MLTLNYGTKANYAALASKSEDGLYFCTDSRELYKGSSLYTEPVRFVSSLPANAQAAQGVVYIHNGEMKVWDGTQWNVIGGGAVKTYTTDGALSASDTDSTISSSKRVYESIQAAVNDMATETWVGTQLASYAPLASPALTGAPTAPTVADATDDSTKIATTAFVQDVADAIKTELGGALHFKGTVATVADLPATGNTEGDVYHVTAASAEYAWTTKAGTAGGAWEELGSVVDLSAYLTSAVAAATYAPLASPALTGTPTAPTAAKATDTTQVATTEFVHDVVEDYAPLASPTLTGTPAAPTAAKATDTTQIATTEFVHDVVEDYAPLNSPAFTGTPTAPTVASASDNTDKIATTAFVQSAVSTAGGNYDPAGSAAAAQAAAEAYCDTKLTWVQIPAAS